MFFIHTNSIQPHVNYLISSFSSFFFIYKSVDSDQSIYKKHVSACTLLRTHTHIQIKNPTNAASLFSLNKKRLNRKFIYKAE